MMYDDYVPRFAIGDRVTANQGFAHERETSITGRRVYRSKAKGPNTYYQLADGTGAWEASLSVAYERVAPEVALSRIVHSFGDRLSYSALSVSRQRNGSHRIHVHLEANHSPARDGSTVTRIDLWADGYDSREVETTSGWEYQLGDEPRRVSQNLGDAIVTTYNASMGAEVPA